MVRAILALVLAVPQAIQAAADDAAATAAEAYMFHPGQVPQNPVKLTAETFAKAIHDPANPHWLLKFYAPWCGHCKAMAPVLEKVAPRTAGMLAIGTIDCTIEKNLCKQHGVRGYPTLKFTLDGDMHDYPGGRKENELVAFAEKMKRPPVQTVNSVNAARQFAATDSQEGVAFLAYHPDVKGNNDESMVQSTHLTQVFAQVARKQRAYSDFLLLSPSANPKEMRADNGGAFICRLEANVAPRCLEDIDGINTVDLQSFVQRHSVATVSQLGPGNFHKIGRNGRPLVIGVVDTSQSEQVDLAKKNLANYAISGPPDVRDKYYYGWFDGKQWKKFLEQFEVTPAALPQVFVLDVPSKTYWQNATYALNIDDFVTAIEDGTIPAKHAGKSGVQATADRLYYALVEYRPWSVLLLVVVVLSLGMAIASCFSPGSDSVLDDWMRLAAQRRPAREQQIADSKPEAAAAAAADNGKNDAETEEAKNDIAETQESKKDK